MIHMVETHVQTGLPQQHTKKSVEVPMVRTSQPEITSAIARGLAEAEAANIEDENRYFETTTVPSYLPELTTSVKQFVDIQAKNGRRIAVVTSGGTTVPLENNTVRFVDNFSAGTRGSACAEYFLAKGYAVIFLHREFSLLPYSRHYSTHSIMDVLRLDENGAVRAKPEYEASMRRDIAIFDRVTSENLLLQVPFTTVNQYLYTLRMIATVLKDQGARVVFLLAAAVSDFFLPTTKLSEHKIQSSGSAKLVIDLDPVPKFLRRLVETWTPGAMIVSFKLETDDKLLLKKCRQALDKYKHQLVIGNLLQTRKEEVWLVSDSKEKHVTLSSGHDEIESVFMPQVIKMHDSYIESK